MVTAQRREESLQDTPIPVTAFSAEDIALRDLGSAQDLEFQVPGLVFSRVVSNSQITIRGVGVEIGAISAEPGVAFNINGVYQGRQFVSDATFDDIERIEVLRGPQGTLYGRNATGGAINLWTKLPDDDFTAEASFLSGNYGRYRARTAVSVPLVEERLSTRWSFVTDQQRDGFTRNQLTGRDSLDRYNRRSLNGVVRLTPTDTTEFVLRADWSYDRSSGPLQSMTNCILPGCVLNLGGIEPADPHVVAHDTDTISKRRISGLSNTFTWDVGSLPILGEATLKSVTAYRYSNSLRKGDQDGASIDQLSFVGLDEEGKQWSQEFTLTSAGDGPLEWVLGGYYYDERALGEYYYDFLAFLGLDFNLWFRSRQRTESVAGFGEATYALTDRIRATAGVRYTRDDKESKITQGIGAQLSADPRDVATILCPGASFDTSWSSWTPKFGIDIDLSDSVMVYASATRGFKAGGWNVGGCPDKYGPETLWSYEVGAKSRWFDDQLQLNVSGFLYDYQDYQANFYINNTSEVRNAADVSVLGVEAEFIAIPFEGLRLNGGGSLQNAEYDDFKGVDDPLQPGFPLDLKGNHLPRAPEKSFFVGAEYTTPLRDLGFVTLRYDYSWRDNYFFTPFNRPYTEQPSFSMSGARIVFATEGGRLEESLGNWEAHLFMRNVGDKIYFIENHTSSTQGGAVGQYSSPRTYGVELRYKFR